MNTHASKIPLFQYSIRRTNLISFETSKNKISHTAQWPCSSSKTTLRMISTGAFCEVHNSN